MIPVRHDLTIFQGRTFSESIRLSQSIFSYKPITGATKSAPCVLSVANHGLPDGWPFKIQSVVGMAELNNVPTAFNEDQIPVAWGKGANGKDYYFATVPSANSVELNDVNALSFKEYSSGGVIVFQPPLDLSIYTSARMHIRSALTSSTILLSLTSPTQIVLDAVNKKITIQLSAVETAAMNAKGVYDLELVTASGVVDCPIYGNVKIDKEVTRQ